MNQPQPPYRDQAPPSYPIPPRPVTDQQPEPEPPQPDRPSPPPSFPLPSMHAASQPLYPVAEQPAPPQAGAQPTPAPPQPIASQPAAPQTAPPQAVPQPVPPQAAPQPVPMVSQPAPAQPAPAQPAFPRPAADPLQPNYGQPTSRPEPGGYSLDHGGHPQPGPSGTGLAAPPPAPAPVMDPHPQHATDWNYVPRQTSVTSRPTPAEWGWRAKVGELTGGLVKLSPGQDELLHRSAIARIRSTLPGSRTLVVANEKGGAGKTPTALILSALLAEYRREAVVAWDVNELRGTLGRRAEISEPPLTVTDVLAAAAELARPEAEVGVLSAYLRRQPEGNLVLASSEDGNAMRQIGHAECDIVRQLLLRRYGVVVCDTGNNAAAPNFLYTVDSADVLVLPTAPSDVHLEVARAMLRMLASRATTSHLVSRAVLVVTSSTGARLEPEEERWFVDRIGHVVHVPADPVIAQGGKLTIADLSQDSIRAWTQVAGAVIEAAQAPSPNDRPRGRRRAPDATPAAPPTPATPPLSAGWIPVTQPPSP
ncbi:MAG: hypothetical protein ACR2N4_18985 [Jatrophihabitans sp.]